MRLFRKKRAVIENGPHRSFPPPEDACGPKGAGQYTGKVEDIKIIHHGALDSYSVAVGKWTDERFGQRGDSMLLMRWNGKDQYGYPHSSDHADWFPIPKEFNRAILQKLHEDIEEKDPLCLAKGLGFDIITSSCQ